MKRQLATLAMLLFSGSVLAQDPILEAWQMNEDGRMASYYETSGSMQGNTYTFVTASDSADIMEVCYDDNYVYVRAEGMTENMGQYQNPGAVVAQDYTWKLARNPQEATNHAEVNIVNSIGVLVNGIPVYGTGDATSWSNSNNDNGGGQDGDGIWNVNAWYSEGWTLDTAFAAHPQQQGAYHTHATPFRLYSDQASQGHSPIVGFSHDGLPIYGPFGYSDPMNANSSVTRIESSYQLRTMSQRTTLPDGTSLTSNQYGPPVNQNHPLGEYNEDYEYIQGLGDLDEHNGRFCITPEYPNGIYAYFVTTDINGDPAYPYFIGETYYGTPETINSTSTSPTIPGNATCFKGAYQGGNTASIEKANIAFEFFPNPAQDNLNIRLTGAEEVQTVSIINQEGRIVKNVFGNGQTEMTLNVSSLPHGTYFITVQTSTGVTTKKLVVSAE